MSGVEKQDSSPEIELQATSDADLPRDATDEEINSLPHIVDKLPPKAWAAAAIGATERFSYYCFVSIWRECMQSSMSMSISILTCRNLRKLHAE